MSNETEKPIPPAISKDQEFYTVIIEELRLLRRDLVPIIEALKGEKRP